jgi:hypothetical protein
MCNGACLVRRKGRMDVLGTMTKGTRWQRMNLLRCIESRTPLARADAVPRMYLS